VYIENARLWLAKRREVPGDTRRDVHAAPAEVH